MFMMKLLNVSRRLEGDGSCQLCQKGSEKKRSLRKQHERRKIQVMLKRPEDVVTEDSKKEDPSDVNEGVVD